jgi:hypothetical protein
MRGGEFMKRGDVVKIYDRPYSRQGFEGLAAISRVVNIDEIYEGFYYNCHVRFIKDKYKAFRTVFVPKKAEKH